MPKQFPITQTTTNDVNNLGSLNLNKKSIKNSYQKYTAQPVLPEKWYSGNTPTDRDILGRITSIYEQDQAAGEKLLQQYRTLQSTPDSMYYNPYAQATNPAVKNLQALGIDTSNIDDNWFAAYKGLTNYYVYGNTTTTPQSPGKNANVYQNAAFEYYQLLKAREDTQKMDDEWAALQQELSWMATKDPRQWSDDKIIGNINWDKYPTLKKMNASLDNGTATVELNHGTDYSRSNLYGVLWAARNGGGSDNKEMNTAYSILGRGNQWQENADLEGKLTAGSDTYSPHSVGSTLYDQMLYFDTDGFDQQWLDENKWMLNSDDETQRKNYVKVAKAEETTQKAEAELAALNARVQTWIDRGWSEERIVKNLNSLLEKSDYSTLVAMDKGMQYGEDSLVGMTRAVNYRKADILNWIHTATANNANKTTSADIVSGNGGGILSTVANFVVEGIGKLAPSDAVSNVGNPAKDIAGKSVQGDTTSNPAMASPDVKAEGKTTGMGPTKKEDGSALATSAQNTAGTTLRQNDGISVQTSIAMDKTAREAAAVLDPVMTPAEQTAAASYSTLASTAAEKVREVRLNSKTLAPIAAAENTGRVVSNYVSETLNMYSELVDYEGKQDELYYLKMEKESLESKLGTLVNATARSFETTIDGYTYQVSVDEAGNPQTIKVDNNGKWMDVTNSPLVTTTLVDQINSSEEAQEFNAKRAAALDELAHNPNVDARVATEQLDRLQTVDSDIALTEDYLAKNKKAYDENVAKYDSARERRDLQLEVLQASDFDTTEIEVGDIMLNYLTQFTKYEPTQWGDEYLPAFKYSEQLKAGADGTKVYADAEAEYKEVLEQIEDVKAARQWAETHGVELSADINNNIDRHLAKLERDANALYYFTLPNQKGFKEEAESGKEILEARRIERNKEAVAKAPVGDPRMTKGGRAWLAETAQNQVRTISSIGDKANYMTDEEKDTYYYLVAEDERTGENKAEEYLDFMSNNEYGVLTVRMAMDLAQKHEDLAASGAGGWLLANLEAVLLAPASAISSGIEEIYYLVTGEERNPYNPLRGYNIIRSSVRETSEEELVNQVDKWFGKDNTASDLAKTIVKGAYQIGTMRADSTMNYLTFGSLFGWSQATGTVKVLEELTTAGAMGFYAASDAAAEAKTRGASDTQAMLIFGATLLAETGTEMIPMDNIMKAFKGGEEVTANTVKDFLKEWLTEGGFKESIGESLSDVISNFADEKVMGALSNHNQRVDQLIHEEHMSPEQAEAQARKEELEGILYTAIISYLSPGADLLSFTAGQYKGYRTITREMNKNGYNFSVRDVRRGIIQQRKNEKAVSEAMANAPLGGFNLTSQTTKGQAAREQAAMKERTDSAVVDFEILETAKDASLDAMSASVAAVLTDEATDSAKETAAAAASNLFDLLGVEGNTPAEELQEIVMGIMTTNNVDATAAKQGIIFAALGGEQSACYQLMQSEAYKTARPDGKASALAVAAQKDMMNTAVQQAVADNVHEYRVSVEENRLMAEGAADAAVKAEAKLDAAKAETKKAGEELDTKRNVEQAKAEATANAANEMANDPSDMNSKNLTSAVSEQAKAAEVTHEYEQSLANAEQREEAVKEETDKIKNDTMTSIRQQAEANVAAQDQQRAEEQAAAEEVQRQQEEEQARLQAEEDEQTGKAQEQREDSLIEDVLDNEGLEEGEERDQRRNELLEQRDAVKLGNIDTNAPITNAEGYLALAAFSRKLGVPIRFEEMPLAVRGKYQNGEIILNKARFSNNSTSVGQALAEAALHEVTHAFSNTKSYQSYRRAVLNAMFGINNAGSMQDLYNNNVQYRAEIDSMISERAAAGDDLGGGNEWSVRDRAEQELIADYARLNLAKRDTVQRFMDAGLGGKMRNLLHNVNQALKNFRLTGEARKTAEYLRRAERAYQKAMNEVAETAIHPEGGQFSVAQIAQATNMTFDPETLTLYDSDGNEVTGTDDNKITPEMVSSTPVGMLIDQGIKGEQNQKAKEMIAGLMNMVARYKDSDLIWEIGATTLSSTFSALKSNSDPQYKTTVDFGTVCAKTQAIVDVMSKVMLDKIDPKTGMLKKGAKRGLTRQEVMKVYDAVNEAGLSVPCPVCYVFSRWMGVPSLLGQMSQYQADFVVTNEDGTINKAETQKKADAYIKKAEDEYGDAKAINNAKSKMQSDRNKLEEKRMDLEGALYDKSLTADQKDAIHKQIDETVAKMTELDGKIGKVSAYNWITQALCKKQGNKFVVDDKFKLTPDSILFDLNKTGEFAKYEKNWAYRNTRGAGMGKAIMPYSGETIGDILYGVKKGGRQIKNPWLTMNDKAAARQLKYAQDRAIKQNLVGGQRLQSTSDFRPEWGLDYIMSFLELQAAGSKVQMYTKVAEAVDFFASVGADVNLSIMGQGQGWHVDENGNKVLDFSSITGMDYETAKALKDKYNNVQMILVGMNDTHIRLAMASKDIDFIIPWHSSGNSKEVLAGLIASVGEKLDSSVDYTTTQTDMVKGTKKKYRDENGKSVEYSVPGKQTQDEKDLWDARMKLLTKGGKALTTKERDILLRNDFTRELYKRFTEKGKDNECYGVKLSKEQAAQIFPYEYWDTSLTKDQADENGKRFVKYCESMGIVPRFSQFKDDTGYWKLLIDRPMYNNDGTYHQQQIIDVTNAKIGALNEEGKLVDSDLPAEVKQAKYAPKDPRSAHYREYTEKEQTAIDNARASIEKPYDEGTEGQYSVYGRNTAADLEMEREANRDYMDAVARGDMEAAQEDVNYVADARGYTDEVFHGTPRFGFTEFDMDLGQGTIFVAYDESVSRTYADDAEVKEIGKGPKDYYNMLPDELVSELKKDMKATYNNAPIESVEYQTQDQIREMVDDTIQRAIDALDGLNWIGTASTKEMLTSIASQETGLSKDMLEACKTPKEMAELLVAQLQTSETPSTIGKDALLLLLRAGTRVNMGTKEAGEVFSVLNKLDIFAQYAYSFRNDDGGIIVENVDGDLGIWRPSTAANVLDHDNRAGIYRLRARPGNQLVIDAQRAKWSKIPTSSIFEATGGDAYDWDNVSFGDYVNTRALADIALKRGYDSVRINNVFDSGSWGNDGFGDIGIFFNKKDVRSADPVTYDDEGNVIPPEERFSAKPDFRWSTGGQKTQADFDIDAALNALMSGMSDEEVYDLLFGSEDKATNEPATEDTANEEYQMPANVDQAQMDAINKGDMEALQKLVEGAARVAGYTHKGTHRTNAQFNVFDRSMQTGKNGKVLGDGFYVANGENTEYDNDTYGKNRMLIYFNPGRTLDIFRDGLTAEQAQAIYDKYFAPYHPNAVGDNPYTSHVLAQLQKSYKVMDYIKEAAENEGTTTDEVFKWLGYDSVKDGPQYVLFDSNQIKSADPITYDDDGNIIPLSQRFSKSPDVRYSASGKKTAADLEMERIATLKKAGVLTQEDIDKYQSKTSRPLEGKSTKWTQSEGPAQRQFGSQNGMLQESDELDQTAINYVMSNNAYFPDTNADQIERAVNWIRKNGSKKNADGTTTQTDGFAESLQKITSKGFDYRSADGQARMVAMMGMAVAKANSNSEDSRNLGIQAQVQLADAFNRQGTDLGRTLQARKLFRLMTPEGRISMLQKMMSNQQEILDAKGTDVTLKFSDWIYMAAAAATEEGDFEKVQIAAAKELADQLPINWKDRLRGWRMLSMLGNPRTHIRNVIGNALFMPAVSIKNKLGAIGELALDKGNRTKTLALAVSKELRQFAKEDAVRMKDTLTGEAKYNENNRVRQQQRNFYSKILQALSDFNSNMLEKEDWFFLKGHYTRALGGWMQANGYTVSDMVARPELLEQGRAYAIQEAQKATYRDFNGLAQKLNDLTRNPKTTGQKALAFGVEAMLPFKKTPANILKRGLEYSPVGLARSLSTDIYNLVRYNKAVKAGKTIPDGALSPTQFIDRLCSGLTGTGILMMGALMGSMGVVTVSLDDDDDKLEKEKGAQEYAFNPGKAINGVLGWFGIPKLCGEDVTFTMDWAAPMSMPFFVGAAVYEQLSEGGEVSIEGILNAMSNIAEPVFNLSMLDGVNTVFKTSQSGDTTALTQLGAKVAANYLTSFLPSAVGAAARTYDSTRRQAFVESGKGKGPIGTFRYAWEQVENKLPGVSQSNIPYRDIWGNAEESSWLESAAENFILPGYLNKYKDDPILNETERVYNATGETKLLPSNPPKSVTYKNQKYVLTAEQYDQYWVTRGQTAKAALEDLMQSDIYQKASVEEQAKMIGEAWTYANEVAKAELIPDYEVSGYGKDPVGTIEKKGAKTYYKAEMLKALNANDMATFHTCVEGLREADMSDSDIRRAISDSGIRDAYKKAYKNDDTKEMWRIEDLLEETDLGFDIESWQAQVDSELDDEDEGYPSQNMDTTGQYGRGNIDLNNRKVVHNADGTISTEQSFSVNIDGEEVLLPTVIDGQIVTEDEAIDHYFDTGEHLGKFATPEEAEEYAEMLHQRQEWYYGG